MAKTNIIENLFVYLAILTPFFPIFLFLINWKKCSSERSLWTIVLYGFFVDFLISYAMGFVAHKPLKITLYASFTFFEYLAFAYFLYLHIRKKSFKKFMLTASASFLVFIVVYYLTVRFRNIDSIPIGFETILILVFSFYYLYEQINDSSTLFIYSKYTFWVIIGIVLYLAGSFFIYIFAGSFLTKAEIKEYWYITNIFSVIKNVFFCIAILIHTKPSKNKLSYNFDLSSLN